MAQTLLIGLGGTGSRVVNHVVKELRANKKDINNGEICCAVFDTNENDTGDIVNSNTALPAIQTSKAQKIRDYFDEYHHLHMETWCPQSAAFMEESMIDGASELRVKSRIAFMDCIESGVINELEGMINEVLKNGSDSKIRIMIVSSLSGGTGSGMFIQVALWLRKFLSESQITIRGIFMLPDVFIKTIKDIRENKTTMTRHYCNAYAAIRELNAITKIKKSNSVELAEQIKIGSLFDSLVDQDSGKPVYDFAFFVDDRDENGVTLDSIGEYEKMVAQLVYMQLYAPMKDDMYSEEDNTFLSFVENEEPLYGACGTSKAVYPTDSIKTYCSIRAAQDAITGGWKKIDQEIDALKQEKEDAEREGIYSNEEIDVAKEYMKIFEEKTAVKAEETGKDKFFFNIAKDIKNETLVKGENGKNVIKFTDKVSDFISLLVKQKIDTVITRNGGTEDFVLDDSFVAAKHSKKDLLEKVIADNDGMAELLDNFDAKVEEYARTIVNSVFPYSMGDVKESNGCTIYGLLAKKNSDGKWEFIHPVAARYILYKLVAKLDSELKKIVLESSREDALTGGDVSALFENNATAKAEETPTEFLESRKWYQREGAFLDEFERRYVEFITTKIGLCEKYEKERLQDVVYRSLKERISGLIKQMEDFFKRLDNVQVRLNGELIKNIEQTNGIVGKTIYVYGSRENKETIYKALNFELDKSNSEVNKSIINALYGKLCAEKRSENPENAAYLNMSVNTAFISNIMSAYCTKIEEDKTNKEIVEMDIYAALCKEKEDALKAKSAKKDKSKDDMDDYDIASGQLKVNNEGTKANRDAFVSCKNKLIQMAAPLLIHDREVSDNELGTVTTRTKTFWGFSPDVAANCPHIDKELGINAEIQANSAYGSDVLYCYRAVYGMEATYVPKFNELKGGMYYKCYSSVIENMEKDAAGRQGTRAYVRTPHLDKNWHKILPYVTEAMREQDALEFFHGFWLAVAYGKIKTDKDGNICLKRSVDGGYGNYIDVDVAIEYNGKKINKTDVGRLIEVLKKDLVFVRTEIPQLEQQYKDEIEELTTYVGTEVMKGLTTSKDELNPIDIVVRYNEGVKHDTSTSAALIGALEKIASELAEKYNVDRSEQKLEEAKYRICKKIYDSSKRTKGKNKIFARWEKIFAENKLSEKEDQ